MNTEEIRKKCEEKQVELRQKYFGNLVHEAAIERPETIGEYTKDLPLKIEAEYKDFLYKLWEEEVPEMLKGTPLVFDEGKLRKLKTDDDRELIEVAYKEAEEQTLWERITESNHKDVTYYKGLLKEYAEELMTIARLDFLEEITHRIIKNKTFEAD